MILLAIRNQHRNDYHGDMQCEHCGHKQVDKYGYADGNYFANVIPAMKWLSCGKSTNSEKETENAPRP